MEILLIVSFTFANGKSLDIVLAGIDRVEGINANITINANVSPNVTIRIIPESLQSSSNLPHSAHQNVTPGQQSSTSNDDQPNPEFIESTPEEISRRVPALAPEIVSQIRDSVANLNDGRPVVIEVLYRL